VFLVEILRFLLIQRVLVDHNLAMECHEVFLLSPKSCSDPWSESGDRQLDLEELTHGFCSSRATQVTLV
jgi:hypothetical protein